MHYTIAIIQHATHGRLLLCQGFGGVDTLKGGAYRWQHGLACKLQPSDTLASLRAGKWNESTSLLDAVIHGADKSRELLTWTGAQLTKLAQVAGL